MTSIFLFSIGLVGNDIDQSVVTHPKDVIIIARPFESILRDDTYRRWLFFPWNREDRKKQHVLYSTVHNFIGGKVQLGRK